MCMHAKVSELSSAALLAVQLCCGAAYPESIPLTYEHGLSQVPVVINGKISLNFTIDSGASDVSIPGNVFSLSLAMALCHPRISWISGYTNWRTDPEKSRSDSAFDPCEWVNWKFATSSLPSVTLEGCCC